MRRYVLQDAFNSVLCHLGSPTEPMLSQLCEFHPGDLPSQARVCYQQPMYGTWDWWGPTDMLLNLERPSAQPVPLADKISSFYCTMTGMIENHPFLFWYCRTVDQSQFLRHWHRQWKKTKGFECIQPTFAWIRVCARKKKNRKDSREREQELNKKVEIKITPTPPLNDI
jgi:hypothetical protein